MGMTQNKKNLAKHLGLFGICFSFVFFFNPNINLIDFLPDFIGYIILCASLRILADLHDDMEAARKNFRYMILLDVVKNLAIFWLFGLSVNTERNTGMLLLCFVFGIGELLLLIPAYTKLFGGLISLAYVHESGFILERYRGSSKKSYTEKIRTQTLFYVIFKAVMAVLPEFSNLNSYDYDETGVVSHSLYEYIGLLRTVAFLFTLVFGIIWLVRILRYFARVRKDTNFVTSLRNTYCETVLPKRGIFVCRSAKSACFLVLIGSIFLADFRLDGMQLLPDVIGIAFFIGGIAVLSPYLKQNVKRLYWLLGAYAVLALAAYIADYVFNKKYYYGAIFRNLEAYHAFIVTVIVSVKSTSEYTATSRLSSFGVKTKSKLIC